MISARLPSYALAFGCGLAALIPAAAAAGSPSLTLGFSNDAHLTAGSDAQRAPWIARARFEGASIVRVDLAWSQVAPSRRGPGFAPRDPPSWHAINPDDVAVPDLYKIKRVLDAALRAGHALPRSAKALWVAEFSWSSRPPNPAACRC